MIITHHLTRAVFLTSLQFICLFTYTTSYKRLIPTQFFRFPSSTPRQSYPLYDVSSHSDPNPSTFPPLSKKAVLKKKPGVPLTAEKNKSKPVKTSSLFSEDYKQRKSSNHPSIATKSDDLDADDAFPLTEEELSQWQQEEIELLKQEQIERYQQLVAAGEEDPTDHPIQSNKDTPFELPSYMQRLFDQWDLNTTLTLEATPAEKLPTVVIIGRPNTGKSTFVNKLTGSYKDGAIVHDEPGITRDRTYRVASWNGYNFQVVDTGGIIFDDTNDIFAERIKYQALIALKEADVAIMVCDGKEGKTNLDDELAEWLRKHNSVPVYVAVSKCESERVGIVQAQDFWSLGLGEPYAVSGIHGTGISDLLDIITSKHMKKIVNVLKENCTNVALIGRPNVGKSSLLNRSALYISVDNKGLTMFLRWNRLVGEERSIVSEVAGTTRDTIDAMVKRGNQTFRLIDTAGIRKKGKVYYGPEFFMVNRAFKAIRRSDVVILLLDALTGIVDQDRILAQRIVDEGRSCVIALNKWDAIPDKDEKSYLKATENIRNSLPGLRFADVLLISAKEGIRTEKLFQSITRSSHQFNRRIPTAILNEVVSDAVLYMTPPTISSKSGRIYYCIQVAAAPPTIVFFVNDPALFPDSYQRFLERKIRDALKFEGTPIRMIFRGKSLREVSRDARRGQIRHTIESVLAKPSRKQLAKE